MCNSKIIYFEKNPLAPLAYSYIGFNLTKPFREPYNQLNNTNYYRALLDLDALYNNLFMYSEDVASLYHRYCMYA